MIFVKLYVHQSAHDPMKMNLLHLQGWPRLVRGNGTSLCQEIGRMAPMEATLTEPQRRDSGRRQGRTGKFAMPKSPRGF